MRLALFFFKIDPHHKATHSNRTATGHGNGHKNGSRTWDIIRDATNSEITGIT